MSLPCFYSEKITVNDEIIILDEDTSHHVIQVLRMKSGEKLRLTDGRGRVVTVEITNDHKKSAQVRLISSVEQPPAKARISIAISLIKNTSRFEWLLEKVTELGISEIIPLICDKTEKQQFRMDRMRNILVSAMLQSQQVWLPRLHPPLAFKSLFEQFNHPRKFIAHCRESEKRSLGEFVHEQMDTIILIGPEGDFTEAEVEHAARHQYIPVMLGETRLRTETAGIVAGTMLKLG